MIRPVTGGQVRRGGDAPAPAHPHAVHDSDQLDLAPSLGRLPITLEKLPAGGLRVTSPDLPGWSCTARGPHSVARCVDEGWNELQIAAYASRRGVTYDAAHHEDRAPEQPVIRPVAREDGTRVWRLSHDAAAWTPLPSGSWRSPSGRTYRADAQVVHRVVARRLQLGLPVHAAPDEDAGA